MADMDELVSQFLMFTGTEDTEKAASYLEMSAGDLERAVSLFMDHDSAPANSGGGAGPAPAAAAMMAPADDVRAPDATQTMRLMDDGGHGMMHHLAHLGAIADQHAPSAFSNPRMDARDATNAAAAAAADEEMDADDDDYEYPDDEVNEDTKTEGAMAKLADMFAPPEHLMYTAGGFDGARTMAKDSKRWLLVNIQKDSEFSSHALNRDVWRDELVENLVREGFIFWQTMDSAQEGRMFAERYHVADYPHVSIIDPRTRRLMWKKEGWTQENPMTAGTFAETAMDFCSRHSFDKPPQAPRPQNGANRPAKRPMHEMSEDEQLQAAMRASLQELTGEDDENQDQDMGDSGDDENTGVTETAPPAEEAKPVAASEPSLLDQLLALPLGDEPEKGARIQLRMPDGKRTVRKFDPSGSVQTIYAFVAQSNEEAKGGKEFVLMAGFPPKDLAGDMDTSIADSQLSGQAITVRWK